MGHLSRAVSSIARRFADRSPQGPFQSRPAIWRAVAHWHRRAAPGTGRTRAVPGTTPRERSSIFLSPLEVVVSIVVTNIKRAGRDVVEGLARHGVATIHEA